MGDNLTRYRNKIGDDSSHRRPLIVKFKKQYQKVF